MSPSGQRRERGEVLAIVPVSGQDPEFAGGRLPTLGGRSLLSLTFEAVRAARQLSRAVVWTDSELIAEEARRWGLEVPGLRPAELRGRHMAEVLLSCARVLEEREEYVPEWVARFQVTYPFRTAELIDRTIRTIVEHDFDSGFLAYPEFHSYWKLDDQEQPVRLRTDWRVPRGARQPIYRDLGGLCSLHRLPVLRQGQLYGEKVALIPIEDLGCTIDIHDGQGRMLADLVAAHRWHAGSATDREAGG